VFLDPPYDVSMRNSELYNSDAEHGDVSAEVLDWCIKNGDNPRYRIVLAGYAGEHRLPETWRQHEWSANRAYGTHNADTDNKENRHMERLWFSPHCLNGHEPQQITMF
jgi:hypothetical protein